MNSLIRTGSTVSARTFCTRSPAAPWLPRLAGHCQDAAVFVGDVGYTGLAVHPEALDQVRAAMCLAGWPDENQLEHFMTYLGDGATAVLFRCTVCGVRLACADASRKSRLLGRVCGDRGCRRCW
nr:CbrC family protein [Streptomyces sp. A244]